MSDPDKSQTDPPSRILEQSVDLFEQIREVLLTMDSQIAEAGEKLSTGLANIRAGLPRDVRVLAREGWFVSYWHTPLNSLGPLADQFAEGKGDQASESLCDHFHQLTNEIEVGLVRNHPDRGSVLTKAFAAHRRGDYELSIPVFLAQADGIAKNAFKTDVYSRGKDPRKRLRERVEELVAHEESGIFLRLVLEDTPLTVSTWSDDYEPGTLNRHGILHGIDSSYGTKQNSFRAISWLQYVDHFREAVEEVEGDVHED